MARPEVLIGGEPANPHSVLAQHLARWGAQCSFANSCQKVCEFLGERRFHLVVCEATLADGSVLRAIPLLASSSATLFCSFPVEDSCLWIRMVEEGRVCRRPSVWRPHEFGRVLREALEIVQQGPSGHLLEHSGKHFPRPYTSPLQPPGAAPPLAPKPCLSK
jgi:hypothetical protein